MDKRFLEDCLAKGMSLPQIGKLAGKDPSTVGYWVKKYGLTANGTSKYAPLGGIAEEVLEIMVEEELTLQEMAVELDCSVSTVRHWLKKFGLQPVRAGRRRRTLDGPKFAIFECRRHGETEFVLECRGYYRCKKCRSAAVAKRRRVVKQMLVEEAGGACELCGYDRNAAALQFHHLDPEAKSFPISRMGHTRSIESAREEAGKCVLLCANCHAEVEVGALEVPIKLGIPASLPHVTTTGLARWVNPG